MNELLKSIDVGCGFAWEGDVNVDVKRPCEVLADAHFLPFKDHSFKKGIMHHVIEHVKNPEKALDELLRVADFVEVATPIRWHPYGYFEPTHIHHFNAEWFKQYAKSRGVRIRGKQILDTKRTFSWFAVELRVWIWKTMKGHCGMGGFKKGDKCKIVSCGRTKKECPFSQVEGGENEIE